MNRFLAAALISLPVALALSAGCSPSHDAAPTDPTVTDPDQLQAPAAGLGFQFKTQLFPVNAGDEIQNCYFYRVGDLAKAGGMPEGEAINLHRIRIVQKAGSHHMNIFRVRTIVNLDPTKGPVQEGKNGVGECFKSSNWADWPLVANTQQSGDLDWTFPDGVANVFQPDEWLMLQTHYVNATTQKTPAKAKVLVNFNFPKALPAHELSTLFATNQNIRVCPGESDKSFTKTCQFPTSGVHVIAANGHFHSRGTLFQMMPTDQQGTVGDVFYTSTSWDDPPMTRDIDIVLPDNGGVQWKCTFDAPVGSCGNPADSCCFTFGGHVDTQEHCNAFVYYWGDNVNPASINCF